MFIGLYTILITKYQIYTMTFDISVSITKNMKMIMLLSLNCIIYIVIICLYVHVHSLFSIFIIIPLLFACCILTLQKEISYTLTRTYIYFWFLVSNNIFIRFLLYYIYCLHFVYLYRSVIISISEQGKKA